MVLEKFPAVSDIAWGRIKEVRVSRDKNAFSFEFDLEGKKQKMLITLANGTTTFTISSEDGTPIVHAIQKGKEVKVLDFSNRPLLKSIKRIKGLKIKKR